MPLDLDRFCRTRPVLFHLTSSRNVDRILSTRRLHPAATLLEQAGVRDHPSMPRRGHRRIVVDGAELWIRDQDPLFPGNTRLEDGWTFEDFLRSLDRRVFFWPGTDERPIGSGLNHFGRYRDEDCLVLVVPTRLVFEANAGLAPQFCKYNSGAPRCTQGRGSPRGPRTFLPADLFPYGAASVVEVTFEGSVALPESGIAIRRHSEWLAGVGAE